MKIETMDCGDGFEALAYEAGETAPIGVGRASVSGELMVLKSLYVSSCGQGIGGLLLENLWEIARSKNLQQMRGCLSTFPGEEEHTREFYEHMGVTVGEDGSLSKDL